jgi:NADH dehydrogenase (ubiquinone) Fe-S protein 2
MRWKSFSSNRIWNERLKGVGVISLYSVFQHACTGPIMRGSGFPWDLRKAAPNDSYSEIPFSVPIGRFGDCYDRYKVRIGEMRSSLQIIDFILNKIEEGDYKIDFGKILNFPRFLLNIIWNQLFIILSLLKWALFPKFALYAAVEAPKGEMGVFLVSDSFLIHFAVKSFSRFLSFVSYR